ncbi:MAG: APC family permease [Chloroflexi bacterium]|jgi:amino acid transporter|nr:APC family permease [Chloroflexota bacterium]
MSAEQTPLRGRKPGDRRVRIERPEARYFRYARPGIMVAKSSAIVPRGRLGRAGFTARRRLFGAPLASAQEIHERLPKWKALAVFSSDVMSSVAYATEASMFTLLAAGTIAFGYLMPISFLIVGLLVLVTFSYRQTIRAYPSGGGSYIVASSNLGTLPGLVAAAALLTDYVLTVAVSVSAGVFNLASAFPVLHTITVPLIVVAILLVMGVNLRGIRESGTVFALPTYIFVVSVVLLVVVGVVRTALGQAPQVTDVVPAQVPAETITLLLLMRAFADGCSAMTGTEAISNGTPAFKPPEWRNAQATMVAMAVILGFVFLGISFLAGVSGAVPSPTESVLSQIGRATFGQGPAWYILLVSTMGILVLAAQTSFADFPRLASILARDGFMPRGFAYRGERLAFNAGIVALAALAIGVAVAFGGRVEALIPLYAIGVFTAFTLSQAGMVRHWLVEHGPGWRRSATVNGIGATATGIVAVVFAIAKFGLGAWVILVIVPILVILMLGVRRVYARGTSELAVSPDIVWGPPVHERRVVIPVGDVSWDVIQAVRFARSMCDDITAVHVTDDVPAGERLRARFERQLPGLRFVIVESPYRNLVEPLIRYLEVDAERSDESVTVVLLPERLTPHWWERILFNQNAHRIRDALAGHPGVLVANVPFRAMDPRAVRPPDAPAAQIGRSPSSGPSNGSSVSE